MMLFELYEKALRNSPDKDAIVFRGESRTYRQLDDFVRKSASALVGLGVKSGDRVAFFMENRPELIEFYLACSLIGAVAVPLNDRFQSAEVVYGCEKSKPGILIVDSDRLPRVKDIRTSLPFLEHLFVVDPESADNEYSWPRVLQNVTSLDTFASPTDPAHPALILFTSGSTRKPKGVTHTQGSIVSTVRSRQETQNLTDKDITLVATGVCHVAGSLGMSLPGIYSGGTVVLLESFNAGDYLESVKKYRPTRTFLLPAQFLDVVLHPEAKSVDFSSLERAECGGGMVTHDLYEHFEKLSGSQVMQVYGLTECEGSILTPPIGLYKRGTIGMPRAGVEIRLVDTNGNEVPVGEEGEILIKSDSMMVGYWDDPENTGLTIVDGWLKTGDIGRRDEDGFLYFSGRIKEIIVKGGSNVAPGEVEDILDEHPKVAISAVVGVPDSHYGELICAFIEPEADLDAPPTVEELASYAREKLAAYKVPDHWTFVEKIPRNPIGKIDRSRLHLLAAKPGS